MSSRPRHRREEPSSEVVPATRRDRPGRGGPGGPGGPVPTTMLLAAVRGVGGVRDAHLRTTANGDRTLRCELVEGCDPTAVATAVAGTLDDRFGVRVDTARAVVVDAPAGAEAARAGAPAGRGRRIRLERLHVATGGLDVRIDVALSAPHARVVGTATGPAVDSAVLRTVAGATLNAVDALLGGTARCGLDQAGVTEIGTDRAALAVVTVLTPDRVDRLVGAALVGGDARQAMVRAVLSAVNRRVEVLLPGGSASMWRQPAALPRGAPLAVENTASLRTLSDADLRRAAGSPGYGEVGAAPGQTPLAVAVGPGGVTAVRTEVAEAHVVDVAAEVGSGRPDRRGSAERDHTIDGFEVPPEALPPESRTPESRTPESPTTEAVPPESRTSESRTAEVTTSEAPPPPPPPAGPPAPAGRAGPAGSAATSSGWPAPIPPAEETERAPRGPERTAGGGESEPAPGRWADATWSRLVGEPPRAEPSAPRAEAPAGRAEPPAQAAPGPNATGSDAAHSDSARSDAARPDPVRLPAAEAARPVGYPVMPAEPRYDPPGPSWVWPPTDPSLPPTDWQPPVWDSPAFPFDRPGAGAEAGRNGTAPGPPRAGAAARMPPEPVPPPWVDPLPRRGDPYPLPPTRAPSPDRAARGPRLDSPVRDPLPPTFDRPPARHGPRGNYEREPARRMQPPPPIPSGADLPVVPPARVDPDERTLRRADAEGGLGRHGRN